MGPVDRRSIVHPLGRAMPPLRHRGRPAASIARQGATDSTGQRLDLPPPPQAPRPYRRLDAAHASTVPGASASTRATSSSRARLDQRRGGLDQAAPGAPPIARAGASISPAVPTPPRDPAVLPPPEASTADPSRRLDARARTAAAARRARPAAGRGEARRRQAPPMSAVDTHSSAYFRASVWTNLGDRYPKPLPGLHTLPGGLTCALPPLRHLWWRLRASDGRPRIPPRGNRQLKGIRSAEGRQTPNVQARHLHPCILLFCPLHTPALTPLPRASGGRKGSPTALQRSDSGGVPGSHTRQRRNSVYTLLSRVEMAAQCRRAARSWSTDRTSSGS